MTSPSSSAVAAIAPRTSGRPHTSVMSPPRSPSDRHAPMTSSERSIFQSGLSSAVTSVKSAFEARSLGSPSSGRSNDTQPKYSIGLAASPPSSWPSTPLPVAGTYTRPPQPRSGNHLMVSGSSGAPASSACPAHALANSSRIRSSQRPYGWPSWGESATKRGSGRGRGGMGAGAYPRLSDSFDISRQIRQRRAWVLGAECIAQVRGGALRRVDVHVDPGAQLEAGADRQPGDDVDVPAELLGPARGGANPKVQLG